MAVRGGRIDTLVPEAYPALIEAVGVVRFPDWPELRNVGAGSYAEFALAKAIRLRQEAGMCVPYASMLSSLDPTKTLMVKVRTETELLNSMPAPLEDE